MTLKTHSDCYIVIYRDPLWKWTIVALTRFHYLQKATNKLLVSIAVSDSMAGLLVPLYGTFFLSPWLKTLKWICLYRIRFLLLSHTASIVNVLMISTDIFISIMYPLRYPIIMSSRTISIIIVVVWCHSRLISTAFIYLNQWDNVLQILKYNFIVLLSSGFFYFCNLAEPPVVGLAIISL